MSKSRDKEIIRRLGEQVAEIAHMPIQKEKINLWKNLNSLNMKRPMVLVYSFPWGEAESTEKELEVLSEDKFYREIECQLRRLLFKWNYMRGDMVIEPVFRSPIYIEDSGFGLDYTGAGKEKSHCANLHIIEEGSPKRADQYKPILREWKDIEKIKNPEISINKHKTEEQYERCCELLEPILRVEKCGAQAITFTPMDVLARLWGINQLMLDMVERPDLIHKAMERLVEAYISRLEQLEKLNILSLNNQTPGSITQLMGEAFTDELPGKDYDPSQVKPHNMWGGAAAQILSGVSPTMHEEFSINHERKWLDRFGQTAYGCCEPLHEKVDILKKIKNLRKISMSSWINVDQAVNKVGNKYVFSYKPNPSFLARDSFALQSSRKEIETVLSKANEYGCQVELILRTIITYRSEPRRLSEWVSMAMEMVGADE